MGAAKVEETRVGGRGMKNHCGGGSIGGRESGDFGVFQWVEVEGGSD